LNLEYLTGSVMFVVAIALKPTFTAANVISVRQRLVAVCVLMWQNGVDIAVVQSRSLLTGWILAKQLVIESF